MSLLLDTNVLSEPSKRAPDARVLSWLEQLVEEEAFVSVISIAELRRGIERLPVGRRKESLARELEDLRQTFVGRLLPVNEDVAQTWGVMTAQQQARGFEFSVMDGFLAATAKVHGLTLVTRNVRDFRMLGIDLLNPWSALP